MYDALENMEAEAKKIKEKEQENSKQLHSIVFDPKDLQALTITAKKTSTDIEIYASGKIDILA